MAREGGFLGGSYRFSTRRQAGYDAVRMRSGTRQTAACRQARCDHFWTTRSDGRGSRDPRRRQKWQSWKTADARAVEIVCSACPSRPARAECPVRRLCTPQRHHTGASQYHQSSDRRFSRSAVPSRHSGRSPCASPPPDESKKNPGVAQPPPPSERAARSPASNVPGDKIIAVSPSDMIAASPSGSE